MKAAKSCLLLIFLLIGQILSGGECRHKFYTHYTTFDGLPDSYIVCSNQDIFDRMWVGTRDGVYYYAGSSFVPFENEEYLLTCSRMTTAIGVDMDGNMWIGSSNGIGYYDVKIDRFTPITGLDGSVNDIDFDALGNAWITTPSGIWCYFRNDRTVEKMISSDIFSPSFACFTDKGELVFTAANTNIYVYDVESSSLRIIKSDIGAETDEFRQIAYIGGRFILASSSPKNVVRLDIDTGKGESLVDDRLIENMAEVQCLIVRDNHYWIGTSYGLIIYDNRTKSIERQFPDKDIDNTLGGESVRSLFEDHDGNVWAGTFNGGLRCWMAYQDTFGRYIADDLDGSLVGETVRSVAPDKYGYIWVGTEEGHLNRFSPLKETFEDYTASCGVPYGTSIVDIENMGSYLWIATYGSGIYIFDPEKCRTIKHYDLPSSRCMDILETSKGRIFVGTMGGLYEYDPMTDNFTFIDVIGRKFIHCIHEGKDDILWVGTYGRGVGVFDLSNGFFRMESVNDEIGLQSDFIISIFSDHDGGVWLTTEGAGIGRVSYSKEDNSFMVRHYTKDDGLPSNSAVSISDTGKGRLWVATTNGLCDFDIKTGRILKTYMQEDRVIGSHFANRANYVSGDKTVYLGTSEGLLVFNPVFLEEKFRNTPLYITSITSGTGKEKRMVSQKGRSVITSDEIVLKESEASYMDISFSSMSYSSPNAISYDCSLKKIGFANDITTTDSHIAYTGLGPGKYEFTVNYHDSKDESTQGSMTFVIKAPWYKSTIGYIMYICLLISGVAGVVIYNKKRAKADSLRKMEIKEIERQKAIAHEKIDFLANIAHEIRTPVTLISLFFDKLSDNSDIPESVMKGIEDNKSNIERLMSLCNDVLDLKKMEYLQKNLVITRENVSQMVRNSVKSFRSVAEVRNLDIRMSIPENDVMVFCSIDAVDSILSNLLSNAVKYCNTYFEISLVEDNDKIVVRVNSDGNRIPEKESERIFEAFYQSKNIESHGAGIGLTYSRSLALLQGGQLYLDTKVSDANSFVLELPKNSLIEDSDIETQMVENELLTRDKSCILVVEDNYSMREAIKEAMESEYDIVVAENGEEALEKISENIVDLVISDIMMPVMDGCKLCDFIKSDIRFSHIPVILLTAAVGIESHIKSLKSGADLYIEKPFKMEVLKESVRNQFRNREIRNEQFVHHPLSHFNGSTVSKVEYDFMKKLRHAVLDNLSDNDLGIGKLSEMMAVSGGTLSKKVKANTGLTVNEYIRICRLKKAALLLADNKYRINEVAYLTGFSTPSYFTQSFRKEFGVLPSEFVKEKVRVLD